MNFIFEKSEALIEFLSACDAVLTPNEENNATLNTKLAVLNLQLMLYNGESIDEYPNKDLVNKIKSKPIPTVKDIEKEFYSNCTRIEDTPFVFSIFSSLWERKLLRPSLFCIYYKNDLLKLIGADVLLIKEEIEKLFKSLSKAVKEDSPDIYKEDEITMIMESLKVPQSNSTTINFSSDIINKVYNKCNDKLWSNINKEDFKAMLCTGNIIIEIRKGNKQRVSALFNRLGMLITNNAEWVKNVEQSLDIDRLNKILKLDNTNSSPNKEFNDFLDEIYPASNLPDIAR